MKWRKITRKNSCKNFHFALKGFNLSSSFFSLILGSHNFQRKQIELIPSPAPNYHLHPLSSFVRDEKDSCSHNNNIIIPFIMINDDDFSSFHDFPLLYPIIFHDFSRKA